MKYYIGVASILLLFSLTLRSDINDIKPDLNFAISKRTTKIDIPISDVEKSEIVCILGENVQCVQHITFQVMHLVSNN